MSNEHYPITTPRRASRAVLDPATVAETPILARRQSSLRELFVAGYAGFADRFRHVAGPGLAVVAIHEATGLIAGSVCLAAGAGAPKTAIVGRHGQADLCLGLNGALSLRHLAIILEPALRWDAGHVEVRYRVLDLHSGAGFQDETGRSLQAIRCESAAVLRVAGYALYCLPVGDHSDWPQDPRDAWSFLPERVFFDELVRCAEGSRPFVLRKKRHGFSRICRTLAPITLDGGAVSAADGAVARVVVAGPSHSIRIDISSRALERGILIGRYARCNAGTKLLDGSVSRVHLLITRSGDFVYAVDTCSTNATFTEGSAARRMVRLDEPERVTTLWLGQRASQLSWQWLTA